MRELNSCYVGIPLPKNLRPEFGKLLADVRDIDPRLELTGYDPHLTLLYLGGQFRSDLDRVSEEVRPMLPVLRAKNIDVGGYGDFYGCTLFLRVNSPPPELEKFHYRLVDLFGPGDNLPYLPHITVCKDQGNFLTAENRRQLIARFDEVDWSFPVRRIMVKGSHLQLTDLVPADLRFEPRRKRKLAAA